MRIWNVTVIGALCVLLGVWATPVGADVIGDPVKWSQPPEYADPQNPGAVGVNEPSSAWGAGPHSQWVADDWLCETGLPVTDIHWWGSWFNPPNADPDVGPLVKPTFWMFQIYADVPADDPDNPYGFSHPDIPPVDVNPLWHWTTLFGAVPETPTGQTDSLGHQVHQYFVRLPEEEWFYQQEDTIYWLKIALDFEVAPPNSWGWHSSWKQWNDDAVTITYDAVNEVWNYSALVYPAGHDKAGQSMDMAFELTTIPEPSSLLLLGMGLLFGGLKLFRRQP